jgi:alanine racemase
VHGLEPGLELCSYLAEVWSDEAGHWIGVAAVGCGDGVRRALRDAGHALVGGHRVRVGAEAMDVLTLDLGARPAEVGEEVVLICGRGGVGLLAEELEGSIGTINHA